ncbi:alpha-1-acid glycoprotein-like [Pygocentrus nattereri]|uniref:alpha-1-acid glycoprotein-like n=1 Tax=Pygocentrus nattereri TaxID=42514 RepID=UPI0018913846|nr:alpha-1-acid glycoprotein-like [Pygocentrus nattereri]
MAILISSILGFLVLLATSQAADPNCEDLTKPLVLEDNYRSIMGKWIFTEGISDDPLFKNLFQMVNSTWITFSPSSLRDTLIFSQGKLAHGTCKYVDLNATFKNSTFYSSENEITVKGNILACSSGCFTLSLTRQMRNETSSAFYLFTRGPRASESEMDLFWKQAECLGFQKEPVFSYDGATELCPMDPSLLKQQSEPEEE